MKRICIVTYYDSSNHGSRLQSTALSEYFKSIGYDVCFLKDFKARWFTLLHPRMFYARLRNKLHEKEKEQFFRPVVYKISDNRRKRLDEYTKKYYKILDIESDIQWRKIIRSKMIFVAGSDIIWQPANGYPAFFFMDYACYAKLHCFSYGSSTGTVELPSKFNYAYKKYLSRYKAIAVRETIVKNAFEKIVGRNIIKVVDPTLLLTKDRWSSFAEKAAYLKEIPSEFIFCYFVMNDPRYWEYVKSAHAKSGLPVVVLPMQHLDEEQPYTIIEDGTPYEFVDLIRNSSFIITDSFHTCVFSLIFEKEFYLLRRSRKAEDAKYDDFLERYKLEKRRIDDESSFVRSSDIDYFYAHKKLDADRKESYEYIRQALM